MLETLDYTIRIGSTGTPTFLYFDLYEYIYIYIYIYILYIYIYIYIYKYIFANKTFKTDIFIV